VARSNSPSGLLREGVEGFRLLAKQRPAQMRTNASEWAFCLVARSNSPSGLLREASKQRVSRSKALAVSAGQSRLCLFRVDRPEKAIRIDANIDVKTLLELLPTLAKIANVKTRT
jgi:hypothetical protein